MILSSRDGKPEVVLVQNNLVNNKKHVFGLLGDLWLENWQGGRYNNIAHSHPKKI